MLALLNWGVKRGLQNEFVYPPMGGQKKTFYHSKLNENSAKRVGIQAIKYGINIWYKKYLTTVSYSMCKQQYLFFPLKKPSVTNQKSQIRGKMLMPGQKIRVRGGFLGIWCLHSAFFHRLKTFLKIPVSCRAKMQAFNDVRNCSIDLHCICYIFNKYYKVTMITRGGRGKSYEISSIAYKSMEQLRSFKNKCKRFHLSISPRQKKNLLTVSSQ
eukprot:TRINITY_DN4545_c0_g2_i1.p1 TRINITY_DN4545_c0_g2~~TRINITY_DN4545_c0_g2_i1.p1  ORF type:complete len:213 (+),score=-4.29 TRINITY_DN4545_c0_g2_i1:148-786(+)